MSKNVTNMPPDTRINNEQKKHNNTTEFRKLGVLKNEETKPTKTAFLSSVSLMPQHVIRERGVLQALAFSGVFQRIIHDYETTSPVRGRRLVCPSLCRRLEQAGPPRRVPPTQ